MTEVMSSISVEMPKISIFNLLPVLKALAKQTVFNRIAEKNSSIDSIKPFFLVSPPGCGKTEILRKEFSQDGWRFVTRNMSNSRLEKYTGIPGKRKLKANGDTILVTEWSRPELMNELYAASEKNDYVLLLLDDWHLAGPDVQACGFELFTDYLLSGYPLPKNCTIGLAGNDSAIAGRKAGNSAVVNRIARYDVYMDPKKWCRFAEESGHYLPIVAFIRKMEMCGDISMFHGKEDSRLPWPSPRSWTKLSNSINTLIAANLWNTVSDNASDIERYNSHIASHVGPVAANRFITDHQLFQSIDTDKVLVHGDMDFDDSDALIHAYAVMDRFRYTIHDNAKNGISSSVCKKNFGNYLRVVERKNAELVVSMFSSLLTFTKEYATPQRALEKETIMDMVRNGTIEPSMLDRFSTKVKFAVSLK